MAAGLAMLTLPGFAKPATPKWTAAAVAYQRAQRLRAALGRRSNPPAGACLEVVRTYQLVYRKDPGYRNTPAALAAAAEVYQEMGRRFASDRDDSKAIAAYQFLAAQYPYSSLVPEALLAVAQIYQTDIEDPGAARAAYQTFLLRFPDSAQAPGARREIARIDLQLKQWERRQTVASRDAPEDPPASGGRSGALVEIEGIRHWMSARSTRVEIQAGGPVKFNAIHLENPPRLVFDLDNTRPSANLARSMVVRSNGFLRRIRVAQFAPRVTRVVLDVPHIERYSVSTLTNPFRLVIEVRGADLETAQSSTQMSKRVASSQATFAADRNGASFRSSRNSIAKGPCESFNPGAANADAPVEETPRTADISPAVQYSLPGAPAGVAPTLTRALGLKIRRIVIDPGHGGHDTGTIGPTGVEEKNVVLDVALRLRKLIVEKLGCQVIMTRTTDTFIPLEERTAIANEYGADLFISIHANASTDPRARGIEAYYLNFTTDPEALQVAARENATSEVSIFHLQTLIKKIALSEKVDESRDFAKIVDRNLALHLDNDGDWQPNRGVKKAPFVVLIGANMPSILAEISFLTNPHDERLLRSPHFRQEIAQALYDGIARYAQSLGTLRVAQQAAPQPIQPSQHNVPAF